MSSKETSIVRSGCFGFEGLLQQGLKRRTCAESTGLRTTRLGHRSYTAPEKCRNVTWTMQPVQDSRSRDPLSALVPVLDNVSRRELLVGFDVPHKDVTWILCS